MTRRLGYTSRRKCRLFTVMAWAWRSIGGNELHRSTERRAQAMTKCAKWEKTSGHCDYTGDRTLWV
jgi:hypothetical protein